jgi:uncharacterized protein (TIGR03437 family)
MKTATIGILLSPLLVMAQQNGGAWTNIGPGPAAVEAIAVDPQGTGTIFIGTIAGGVRKSLDHGTTWSAINSGLTNLAVLTLTMDASGPQTVYAGTSGNGLFKTGDGGASWKNLTAITGAVISVAADPKRPGVVYAAAFNNLASGSISKSIDGGVTWATIFPSTAAIYNITIDPGNSDVLYAPTVGHGAFKSTDGGQHWSSMLALTPAAIWTLALDPANSQVLYAGTNEDGIWKSTDAGNTWQHVGSPGPFPVYSVTVDASTHMVYAGTNGGGFWTSPDGGVTWQPTGLSNGMVLSLAVDPGGILYAGTNSVGAQVSRDHGATWTTVNAGLDTVNKFAYGLWIDPSNGKKILVGNEAMYGLIGSQDGGATWSVAGQGFTGRGSRGVAFDPSDSQRIYAGAMIGNGFFKSTDGGLTWSLRKFGSPAVYVIAVAVDPSSPNAVYVGTQNEGFFRSENYGETWESIGRGLSGAITYLTVDPTDRGRLFACTATAFYLSEDGGNSWTNVLNFPAWTLTIDPGDPSTVYATARTQGVFRSSDGGYTWQSVNSGLTNLTMGRSAPVIVDPKNRQTLYVGGEGGVFKSLDGGGHWFAVNSGLSDLSVLGLAMDPSNSSALYACGPNGIYKTLTGAEVQSASILITGFGNAASYAGGPVSPGEIVVITGYGLGPAELIPGTLGANGLYSTQLSGTTVRFNAIPAPLIYTSATQVAALVPDMVSLFSGGVQVTVTYEGRTSISISSNVVSYYPGVFTLNATGTGQAVAQNEDGSINTASNPAKVGDVISLYVTGLRQADSPTSPVFVIIGMGGQAISSSTKDLMPGVLQVDARIPGGVQTGSAVPVLVVVGDPSLDSDSSTQLGVTIAVQPDPSVTATITSIGWATAVTTDPAGNVYFVSSNSVFKVDSRGVLTRIAGNLKPGYSGDGGPAIDAELYTDDLVSEEPAFGIPSGLATDLKGNLYISDGGNGRVRKISSDGIITTVAGNGSHGYSGDGGPATAAQISNPRGLAVDSVGNLYIADSAAVRMVSTAGIISTVALFGGLGVAVDSGGNIFVVDYSRVRRVSPNGTVTTVAGGTGIVGVTGDGGPATSAGFIGPTAVALDRAGNLYIGDVSRVRKVSPDGIINTVAGGGKINLGDGEQAIDAQIAVESITIDAAGNLYIAGYGRVRKVLPDGTITTVAGNGN